METKGGRPLPDGMLLRALAAELAGELAGARLERILAPAERLFRLRFRLPGGRVHRLEVALEPAADGILLDPPEEPAAADGEGGGFLLVQLRRRLEGARLEGVEQPGWERLLRFRFLGRNALGDPVRHELVAELMGPRSNLLLLEEGGRIVDALRRAGPDQNPLRPVLPGLAYLPPPPPREGRWQPGEGLAALEARLARLAEAAGGGRGAERALAAAVAGMGPAHARLALEAAGLGGAERLPASRHELSRLARSAAAMLEAAEEGRWQPATLEWGAAVEAVAVVPGDLPPGRLPLRPAPSVAAALARAAGERLRALELERRRARLAAPLRAELERWHRRLEAQRRELAETEPLEEWRREGELLLAHAAAFPPGVTEAEVADYFDPEMRPRLLRLAPGETAVGRAKRLFQRYRKALRRREVLLPALEAGERRARYLESVLLGLEQAADLAELGQVEEEMEAEGLLRPDPARRRAAAAAARGRGRPPAGPAPLRLLSHDGWEIWLGRNNRQNDELTMRLARPRDLWFHARGLPGAHVLLPVRGRELPPERTRLEAAVLAALHSRAAGAGQVEVDWTERQNVWKPHGAPPGFVLYRRERTLAVRPDPTLEAELRALAASAPAAPGPPFGPGEGGAP